MGQNLTRQQVIDQYGFDPEASTPALAQGMTREQVIKKYGFDPAIGEGGPPTIASEQAQVFEKYGKPALSFVAKEGPKMVGAAGGSALALGLGQPLLVPPLAAAGSAVAEGIRQGASKLLGTEEAPKSGQESIDRLIGFPSGAVFEGAAQELGPAFRATKFAANPALKTAIDLKLPQSPYAARAAEFRVPMTPAQSTQSPISSMIEGWLRKTIGGPQIFKKFDDAQALRLNEAAREIARGISPQGMSQLQWGEAIKQAIEAYPRKFGEAYEAALTQIGEAGGNKVPLNLQELVKPAKDLLAKIVPPADYAEVVKGPLGTDILHVTKILKAFATPLKKVASEEGVEMVPKNLTFEGARRLRSILYSLSNSGTMDTAKGAIKKMNEALDASMGNALKSQGMTDLYENWHNASTNYRMAQEVVENKIVQAINANATPEEIAKGILTSGTESKLRLINKIAPRLRRATASAVFQSAYERSLRDGILVGDALNSILGDIPGAKVSKDALKVLFPGHLDDDLGKIQRFINTVDTIHLRRSVTVPQSAQPTPLLVQASLSSGAFGSGMVMNVLQSGPGGWALALGGPAVTILSPIAFSKLVTRPGAIDMATKALRTSINSAAGRALAARLATVLGIEATSPERIPTMPPSLEEAAKRYPKPKETP
jgi:hypothetical protein